MRHLLYRHACILLASVVTLAAVGSADAAVRADVFSTISNPLVDLTAIDPVLAEFGPTPASGGGDSGLMQASADLNAASLLRASASATINGSNTRTAIANAAWQDVLLASGAVPPSSVRFVFTIEGDFTYTNVSGGSQFSPNISRAIANLTTRTSLNFNPLGWNGDTETTQVAPDDLMVRVEKISRGSSGSTFDAQAFAGTSQAWLTESLVETTPGIYHFEGTFAVESALKSPAQIGFGATESGYVISLGLSALAGGRGGSTSTADLFNTLQLTAVTQPDGSPLPGDFGVLFDSGLTLTTPLQGDLDGDGFVGIDDLNLVLGNWNQNVPPGNPLADPSGDGFVGIDDLNEVLGNWNAGTPPINAHGQIPEPASFVLIGLTALTGLRCRTR